jgi:hypothetical protein
MIMLQFEQVSVPGSISVLHCGYLTHFASGPTMQNSILLFRTVATFIKLGHRITK